jgi:hypothetical protein
LCDLFLFLREGQVYFGELRFVVTVSVGQQRNLGVLAVERFEGACVILEPFRRVFEDMFLELFLRFR